MKYTILRPVVFFDNLSSSFGRPFATMWRQMGEVKLALVATRDIGIVAAKEFEEGRLRTVTLVGEQLTFKEGASVFREVVMREMERS